MKASLDTLPSADSAASRTGDFLELTKPRITFLVLITTMVAFYVGVRGGLSLALLCHTLFGTALVASGASAFNMYLERNLDALMLRTIRRPLPSGRVQSGEALIFAVVISSAGMIYLFIFVNHLTSLLSALTFLSYLFLYTPLKTKTWLCTIIGAVPGALPVTMGWAAATGGLSAGAWVLFGIVFLWQMPHFYAIGWMYREDYARAGFPMLPVIDATGSRTGRQINLYNVVLILLTVMPLSMGFAGFFYLAGAIVLGALYFVYGAIFSLRRDRKSAKHLFLVSIAYLPVLMTLLMLDKTRS